SFSRDWSSDVCSSDLPFFIMSGALMNEAQLTHRLVQFCNHLVGRWRGGLAQVNVLSSMFFGGITGAATADVAALGPILIPAMVRSEERRVGKGGSGWG